MEKVVSVKHSVYLCALVMVTGLSAFSRAEVTVIGRLGPTQEIRKFYIKAPPDRRKPVTTPKNVQVMVAGRLPLMPSLLSPGAVKARRLSLPQAKTPLFLLGSDKRSIAWLRQNKTQLMELGAKGYLVQAKTLGDVKKVSTVGKGLRISLASGDPFAERLGIKHYPVLISKGAIEQ